MLTTQLNVAEASRSNARVVHVLMLVENNSYPKDPRVRKEAKALRKAGYRVSVICPKDRSQRYHETIEEVKVYRYPTPRLANDVLSYLFEYAYSMVAMFVLTFWVWVRHDFDVIHTANPPDTLVFIAACYKIFGKRFVFDHHDLAPEMYYARFSRSGKPWIYQALIFCEKLSCRLADHVFAVNESYKATEMSRNSVPESRITVVRNGPELESIIRIGPNEELRKRAGTIIAYAGIIGVQDGVDLLLRALRNLIVELRKTDLLCLIIGDGDALPGLRRQAAELSIAEYVQFTGWINDANLYRSLISTADICVDSSPSNSYNDSCTAIKMMEYMAAGKPIVAFDLPEHRFTAQSSAIYARPNDELEFARAIAELMDDAPRREAMGVFGRDRIERQLAWSYSAARLLEAYGNLDSWSSRAATADGDSNIRYVGKKAVP